MLLGDARLRSPLRQEALFMLFLAAYICMLRAPSEGLPVVCISPARLEAIKRAKGMCRGRPPVACVTDTHVEWFMWRRKNINRPTSLKRACWCTTCKRTCPVHVLGGFLKTQHEGARPFASFPEVRCVGRRVIIVVNCARVHFV